MYRMVVVRQLFLMIRQATVTIQAFTRGTLARRTHRQVRTNLLLSICSVFYSLLFRSFERSKLQGHNLNWWNVWTLFSLLSWLQSVPPCCFRRECVGGWRGGRTGECVRRWCSCSAACAAGLPGGGCWNWRPRPAPWRSTESSTRAWRSNWCSCSFEPTGRWAQGFRVWVGSTDGIHLSSKASVLRCHVIFTW